MLLEGDSSITYEKWFFLFYCVIDVFIFLSYDLLRFLT